MRWYCEYGLVWTFGTPRKVASSRTGRASVLLAKFVADGACHAGAARLMTIDTCLHLQLQDWLYRLLCPDVAVALRAQDSICSMGTVPEKHEIRKLVDRRFRVNLCRCGQRRERPNVRPILRDRRVACHAGRCCRKARPLSIHGSSVTAGALQLERGVKFMTELLPDRGPCCRAAECGDRLPCR